MQDLDSLYTVRCFSYCGITSNKCHPTWEESWCNSTMCKNMCTVCKITTVAFWTNIPSFFLPATHDRKLKILNTLEKTVNLNELTKVRNEIRAFGSECGVYHELSAFPWGQHRGVSEGFPFSSIPGNWLYLDISYFVSILCSPNTSFWPAGGNCFASLRAAACAALWEVTPGAVVFRTPLPPLSRMSKPWITCEFGLCLAAHRRFGVPLQPLAWGN